LSGAERGFCAGPDLEEESKSGALVDEICGFSRFGVFAKNSIWANPDVPNLELAMQLENRNPIVAGTPVKSKQPPRPLLKSASRTG
jgi:hypothetical protein